MGWLWSSSNSPPSQEPSQTISSTLKPPQPPPATDSPPTSTPEPILQPPPPTPKPRTRDQVANDEVLAFFRGLQEDRKRQNAPPPDPDDDDDDNDPDDPDDPDDDPPELLTPARLYDTHASCTTLFDTAFHCASPGGQFFNVYRYGTLRQCGKLWRDVMWCMRTNRGWMNEREREERTVRRAWERERERLRERGGCSEEVWGEGRRWVEREAFKGDWESGPFSRRNGGGL